MAICDKLASGQVEYENDSTNRRIRLINDIPQEGNSGAFFSKEWVEYDKINKVLGIPGNQLKKNSTIFQECFASPTSNTGPMLAAVLVDVGIIDKNYKVLKLL